MENTFSYNASPPYGYQYPSQRAGEYLCLVAANHSNILLKIEYLGHTVNFKPQKKSYSSKKGNNKPYEWVFFKNTHEAIVAQKTFDIV